MILSIDEITLCLFPEGAGEKHDVYVLRAEQYLLSLSLQILRAGRDVILDWGLWTKAQRDRSEIHYLKISPEEWENRIRKRNAQQKKEEPASYLVDEGLLRKVEELFEEPSETETDLIIEA